MSDRRALSTPSHLCSFRNRSHVVRDHWCARSPSWLASPCRHRLALAAAPPAKPSAGLARSSPYPGARTMYTVNFTATAAIAAGGSIFLSETAGPTDFSTETLVQVIDETQAWGFYASGVAFGTGVTTRPLGLRGAGPTAAGAMGVSLKDAIKAGDVVSVSVTGATNPGAGKVSDFEVYTTSNTTAGLAAPYRILTVAESIGGISCPLPPGQRCYSPQAFRTAYGMSPLLAKGIDGRGQCCPLRGLAARRQGDQHLPGRVCFRYLFPPSPRRAHGRAGDDAKGLSGPGRRRRGARRRDGPRSRPRRRPQGRAGGGPQQLGSTEVAS